MQQLLQEIIINKKTPNNIAAERAVLSGLCQYGSDIYCDLEEILTSECFYDQDNQITFNVIKEILKNSATVDISSIISCATQLGFVTFIEDKDNKEYIKALFKMPISKENVKNNTVILKKLEIARAGQKMAGKIYYGLSEVNGAEKVSEIVNKVQSEVLEFELSITDSETDKTTLIGDGVDDFIEHLANNDNSVTGIPSFISSYNHYIGGGRRRGGVYLIGARPKTFKSTIAINDGLFCAKNGTQVLYLDTEMNKEGQLPRILSCLSGVLKDDIESGKFGKNDHQKNKVTQAANYLKSLPFSYRRIAGKPFEEVLSIIKKWAISTVGVENGRRKDAIIIYDYFKLMSSASMENMQEFQALGFQISALCDFCGDYDIPCSAFVQLNRDGIDKNTSDIISQSDRLLWLCSSFSILRRKTQEEIETDGYDNGTLKLIPTAEQRHGPGMEEGNYINLLAIGEKATILERKTAFEIKRNGGSGFEVTEEDELSDEDFDHFTDPRLL